MAEPEQRVTGQAPDAAGGGRAHVVRAGLTVHEADLAHHAARTDAPEHDHVAQRLVDDLDLAVLDEQDAARRAALVEEVVARPRLRDLRRVEQPRELRVVEIGDELAAPRFGPER